MGTALQTPPRKQHTLSQVVLRRFTVRDKLAVSDLRYGGIRLKKPGEVFFEQLDKHNPWTAEDRWGQVETKMARVYSLIDKRTVLEDLDAVDTLRDLVAMHWIRTPAFLQTHERILRGVAAQSVAKLDCRPELLTLGMQQITKLVPGGPTGLAWFNRRLHAKVLAANADEFMSGSLATLYEGARRIFAGFELQIGYSDEADFMIGDAPVIVRKPGHAGAGLHQGVALGDANEIAMPISPHVVVGFGKDSATLSVDDDAVHRYNQLQLQTAVRRIGWQPGGVTDGLVRSAVPGQPQRPQTEIVANSPA